MCSGRGKSSNAGVHKLAAWENFAPMRDEKQ